ncbi:diacylglycerol/lipid kinase family protein [Nocardioides cheoyonin]|uniref:diacylglycerol/lipid kinase family protein n=1 Tax=Nocardioides cheoyonin TaxID=3156615 RepID=UPI0032B61E8C
MRGERLLVVGNPGARGEALEAALTVLRAHGDVEVAITSTAEELDDALAGRCDAPVVVAGGDGTMHAVVGELHRRGDLGRTTVGLLPLGTGNDFARGNGLPLDPAEAARVVVTGQERQVDLIVDDTGSVVVNNVHVGVGTIATLRAERWKHRLGRVGYPIGAFLTALRPPTLRLDVEVDGVRVAGQDRILQVAVGNGSQVGGGTALVPDARPHDGRLDVIVSRPVGAAAMAAYAVDLVRGRHHRRGDVGRASGREVTVSGEEFWCTADGETQGPVSRRTWRIEQAAYTLLVP